MNKNPYAYLYWGVLAFILYSVAGVLTEHEFLPNPIWLITGTPEPGFCSDCRTGLALIAVVIILIPIAFWLRSKTKGERAIISRKNLAIVSGIALVVILIVGGFLWQREMTEENFSQAHYQALVQNNNIIRRALAEQKSPLHSSFLNLVIENGIATVYFTEDAAVYLNSISERKAYLDPIRKVVLEIPGGHAVQWQVGERIITY